MKVRYEELDEQARMLTSRNLFRKVRGNQQNPKSNERAAKERKRRRYEAMR
jgi:hypothetical protein